MLEYLEIGSSPANEDCAQVGTENYHRDAGDECIRFKQQLNKIFGPLREELGLHSDRSERINTFETKSFPHDFGRYFEVVVWYDDDSEDSLDFAYFVESHSPLTWHDDHVYTMDEFVKWRDHEGEQDGL